MAGTIPPDCLDLWTRFCASRGNAPDLDARFLEAFYFCDNAADAKELADLVVAGVKRATAGLVWEYEHENEPLPVAGTYSIVTDFDGTPRCVIATRHVEVKAFGEVDAAFAATEGEGDGSLAYWRRAHWEFFSRHCARIGRAPSEAMPVVCEVFEVVYRG